MQEDISLRKIVLDGMAPTPRGYKTYLMLNSTEHDICNYHANKCYFMIKCQQLLAF